MLRVQTRRAPSSEQLKLGVLRGVPGWWGDDVSLLEAWAVDAARWASATRVLVRDACKDPDPTFRAAALQELLELQYESDRTRFALRKLAGEG